MLCFFDVNTTMPASMIFISSSFTLLAFSYLRLKFLQPNLPRKYTVPGGHFGAVLAVLPLIFASAVNVIYNLTSVWRAVGVLFIVVLGIVAQYFFGIGTGAEQVATHPPFQRTTSTATSATDPTDLSPLNNLEDDSIDGLVTIQLEPIAPIVVTTMVAEGETMAPWHDD
eukprot:c18966_g1_i2.p1 GENE.c18966_g1_i2~~c18966_g1_i2.p1  ORF type:complete len:169 (-),score=36.65 c18966_g1_i2:332-838(-)